MAEGALNRVPPHNLGAEKSVLGAMMLDVTAVSTALEHLQPEDFYFPAHSIVFEVMRELSAGGNPVDFVTVSERMERRGVLEKAGGYGYLTELNNFVPSIANMNYYLEKVKDYSRLRRLITAVSKIAEDCYEASKPTEVILSEAEKAIFDISQSGVSRGFVPVAQAVQEAYDRMEYLAENGEESVGVPTGFATLDERLKGLQKSQLIVVAARPSMGKSALAMNIVQYAATYRQKSAAVFSLEMPYEQLAQRMLSTGSRVPLVNIRTGIVEDMSDWTKVAKSVSELSQTKIFIDDTPNISVMEMMSRCRRLKLEHGLDIVMIDYLQLISGATGSGNRESRQVEVSEMARALKLMANELQVPVVLLSQLSRGPDQRENHRPILSDLRESGAIEQDADVVMFIYRGSYYEDYSAGNDAEIIVAKQRNGATGTVRLAWDGTTASFLNLDKRHNAQDFA